MEQAKNAEGHHLHWQQQAQTVVHEALHRVVSNSLLDTLKAEHQRYSGTELWHAVYL